jgi:DNA-binding CsgD family transcriptional regulator
MNPTGMSSLETFEDQASGYDNARLPLDASFKHIFDDLRQGVLVMDTAGRRVYSNPALNELVRGNACHPGGSIAPPFYVPVDQRQKYILALQGTSSLLAFDGSGTASTWLDLAAGGEPRVRTKITISAFTGVRGWRFAVWLFNPELPDTRRPSVPEGTSAGRGPIHTGHGLDPFLAASPISAVESLTKREKDVLHLLLDGLRVSSIARNLYLSPQTVRNHLKAIFRKLGAHSQAELLDSLRAAPQRSGTSSPPLQDFVRSPTPNLGVGTEPT